MAKRHGIDSEWILLMLEAKELGLSTYEIRDFLKRSCLEKMKLESKISVEVTIERN